jgi:hypothetical protein
MTLTVNCKFISVLPQQGSMPFAWSQINKSDRGYEHIRRVREGAGYA